jgi:hypothetical protein
VALLVTVVLGDEVEVLATDDDGALHLGRDDLASEDTTADRDITGEGALLVDVVTLNGLLGGLEAKTDLLVPAVVLDGLLAGNLGVLEDTLLLLESLFDLFFICRKKDWSWWVSIFCCLFCVLFFFVLLLCGKGVIGGVGCKFREADVSLGR